MSSIDRRVVEMEFDNKQFENGIRDTLASLEALKQGLKLEGATRGLREVSAASEDIDLDGISRGVEKISTKFSALGAIGFTVIQSLTRSAMNFASRIAGMVFDPLVAGGRRRAMNIEQAQFQFRGLGMDVEATMASALDAVRGTAYGLDEAARAAGQFGASGMRAGDDMTSALRAISGVAAMTNSSYEDMSQVFTKVAGNGRVMGDDLLRLSSRGLNAAATLANELGITEAEVRNMVTEGQVSFEMFYQAMDNAFGENATKANETYTGSLANMRAALSRIGAGLFTPWLTQQRDLFNALTPAIDGVGSALKPVIAQFTSFTGRKNIQMIDRLNSLDFSRLSMIFTPAASIIRNVATGIMSVLNPIKDAFRDIFPPSSLEQINDFLRGITRFTSGLKMGADGAENLRRTFAGVFAVFSIGWTVIKEVGSFLAGLFGMVFDGSGGFLEATANIGDFFVALDQAIKNGEGLKNFFAGFTHILTKPIEFVKELARAITSLFDFDAPSADDLSSRFEVLGRIGSALVKIWDKLAEVMGRVWGVFQPLARRIAEAFAPVQEAIVDFLGGRLDFETFLDTIRTGLLGGLLLIARRFVTNMGQQVGGFAHRFTQPFNQMTISLRVMQGTLRAMTLMQIAVAIGLLAASAVALSLVDPVGLARAMGAISVMMGQLIVTLSMFQRIGGTAGLIATSAGLILFAIALRILTSSVKALAELEWEDLARGLAGVTGLIAGVTVAVMGMSGHTRGMFTAGAGLLILATGIRVLVTAVTDLSGLSWEEMQQGLVGVGGLLASLAIFTRMAAVDRGGVLQGTGLLLLATGIRVLAQAVLIFAELSWEEIGRGLGAVAGILASFAIFTQAVNPSGIVRTGLALVLVGAAMQIMADALQQFATMEWDEIGRGLAAMAGALAAVAIALSIMPPSTLASATALVVVSYALGMIFEAVQNMGGMEWGEIGRGLVTLAGSLAILAIATISMTSALPGAAAVLVVASALAILAPVLMTFSAMSLGEMGRSLGMLAGVFLVLGIAGMALGPLVPVLYGIGAAVALLGAGMLMLGIGVTIFATGLAAVGVAAAGTSVALIAMLSGIIGLIPLIVEQVGLALIILIQIIAEAGPEIVAVLVTIIGALLEAINEHLPGIIEMLGNMILELVEKLAEIIPPVAEALLEMVIELFTIMNEYVPDIIQLMIDLMIAIFEALTERIPEMAQAGTDLMVAYLNSVRDNIGAVVDAAVDLMVQFLESVTERIPDMAQAGTDIIVAYLNSIEDNIGDVVDAVVNLMIEFLGRVTERIPEMARAGTDIMVAFLNSVRDNLGEVIDAGVEILVEFVDGITRNIQDIIDAGVELIVEFMEGIAQASVQLVDAAFETLIVFLNGLSDAIDQNSEALGRAGGRIAASIATGLITGIGSAGRSVWNAAWDLGDRARQGAMAALNSQSPSRVFMQIGEWVTEGFVIGMQKGQDDVKETWQTTVDLLTYGMETASEDMATLTERLEELMETRSDDVDAIKETEEALAQATLEQERYSDALEYMASGPAQELAEVLLYLGADVDMYTEQLADATRELEDMIAAQERFQSNIAQQYANLPRISDDTSLDDYISELTDANADIERMQELLAQLRDMGLSDDLYEEFVQAGTSILPFLEELSAGGEESVDIVNELSAELAERAEELGEVVAAEMYDAGIEAMQGLIDGLEEKIPEIEARMERIAAAIVEVLQLQLQIQSPSKVMERLGKSTIEGLSEGMRKSAPMVSKAAEGVGKDAFHAMKKSISGLSELLAMDTDLNPTITPVLDLSTFHKDATQIGAALSGQLLDVDSAYSKAKYVSAGQRVNHTVVETDDVSAPAVFTYNQYNNSPKALSSAEIYRQTKNQLSVTKGALAPNAAQDA